MNTLKNAAEFAWHHKVHTFRSALFLASMMLVLDQFYWFEWLNVFLFRVISTIAQPSVESNETGRTEVLVFTIQEDLFETEFKSRSPIDRKVLYKVLEKLTKAFPPSEFKEFKVLAIDYDLSPNNYDLDKYRSKKECIIADKEEENAQNDLDNFLRKWVIGEEGDIGKRVVLINHIPVKNQIICECKKKWEQDKVNEGTRRLKNGEVSQGILFGQPDILHYGLLGPVMKYAKGNNSFPEVVDAAEKGQEAPLTQFPCTPAASLRRQFGDKTFKPLNFFTNGAVKTYGLDDLNAPQFYREYVGERANDVKVIFFGGNYGRDDIYVTPIGERPGVTIHAYTYYSINDPVHEPHWKAWVLDIGLGFFSGLIFHIIWHLFHHSRAKGALAAQVGLTVLNFLVLGGILVVLVHYFARLLSLGLWLSPGPMLIGLFIDSYVASATGYEASNPAIREGDGHDTPSVLVEGIWFRMRLIFTDLFIERSIASNIAAGKRGAHGFTLLLCQFFGVPNGVPNQDMQWWDFLIYGILKIAVFWMIIGIAVYIIVTAH